MGQIQDIVESPEFDQKTPLEKAQSRYMLFGIMLDQNPDVAKQFAETDDVGKKSLADAFTAELTRRFPKQFTVSGNRYWLDDQGNYIRSDRGGGWLLDNKSTQGTQVYAPVEGSDVRTPIYDTATEAVLENIHKPEFAQAASTLTPEERKSIAPLAYERFGPNTDANYFGNLTDLMPRPEGVASQILPTAARVGMPIIAAIGTRGDVPSMAKAGAAGEMAAQAIERYQGTRRDYSPEAVALNTVLSIIPGSKLAAFENPIAKVAVGMAQRGLEGAAIGAGAQGASQLYGNEPFSLSQIGEAAKYGMGLGAVLGGLEGGLAAKLAGKNLTEQADILARAKESATKEQTAAIETVQEQINQQLGIGQEVKPAAESAAVIDQGLNAAGDMVPSHNAQESMGVIQGAIAEKRTAWRAAAADQVENAGVRAEGLNAARAEELRQGVAENQLAAPETVATTTGADVPPVVDLTRHLNDLDAQHGVGVGAARERARVTGQLDALEPPTPEMSSQAARMLETYGRVSPQVMAGMAGGGAGVVVGSAQGMATEGTPEERLKRAVAGATRDAVIGFSLGYTGVGMLKYVRDPAAYTANVRGMLYHMATGTEDMPDWYLKFRSTPVMQNLREGWYNSRSIVKDQVAKVASKLTETGQALAAGSNPFLAGKLYPRVSSVLEQVVKRDVNASATAIGEVAKASPLGHDKFVQEFNLWMEARHTPDYNAARVAVGEPLNRMDDTAAAVIMDRARQTGLEPVFEDLAKKYVQPLIQEDRRIRVQSGLLDPEHVTQWETEFPNYVPLNREIPEEGLTVHGGGGGPGISVLSSGIKGAHGSDLPVADILGSVYANYTDAVQRAARNEVAQSAINFFREAEAAGEAIPGVEVRKPKVIGNRGKVPLYEAFDPTQVIEARFDGKPVRAYFTDPRMALAYGNLNADELMWGVRHIAEMSRMVAGMKTRLSVDFILRNVPRDRMDAAAEAASRGDARGAFDLMNPWAAAKGDFMPAIDAALGRSTPRADEFNRMVMAGGLPGGWASSTKEEFYNFVKVWEKERQNPLFWTKDKVMQIYDMLGEVSEGSTRFAAWRRALDVGATEKEAALAARDSSLDFNMRGTHTPLAGALYNFFNPAVQSVVKAGKWGIRNPGVVPAMISTAYAISKTTDAINSSWDPDWKKNPQVNYGRMNGYPVIYGKDKKTGEYLTITLPVAQSMRPAKALMDFSQDLADGTINSDSIPNQLARVAVISLDAANPLGNSNSVLGSLTPSVVRPAFDATYNRDWNNKSIVPLRQEENPLIQEYGKYAPGMLNSPQGRIAIAVTNTLHNELGVSISPGKLRYTVAQYGAGPAKTAAQLTQLVEDMMQGSVKATDIPGIAGVTGRYSGDNRQVVQPGAQKGMNDLSDTYTDWTMQQTARTAQVNKIAQEWDAQTPDQRRQVLVSADSDLRKKIIAKLKNQDDDPMEVQIKSAPVAVRAGYILKQLDEAPTAEDQRAKLLLWKGQGLLTPDVLRAIQLQRATGKN